MICLCGVGTFLAYQGPLSSAAWQGWDGADAWKRDLMRAIVSALLSLFVLWSMDVAPEKGRGSRISGEPIIFNRYEKRLFLAIFLMLLLMIFYILPAAFISGLDARGTNVPRTFDQIMKPYFPYFLYAAGLWIGIITPVFLFLIRAAARDWAWWKEARARLYGILSRQVSSAAELTAASFQELTVSFQNYVIGLKNIAERYLPVLLAMSLGLMHEQLTTVHESATPESVEAAKVASWLFLGPALIIFITLVALGYQSAVKKAEAGFSPYIEILVKSPDKFDILSAMLVLRANFIWEQSPLSFVISAIKSASVSIPLLLALTIYVLQNLIKGEAVPLIFIPRQVLEFLKGFY
jgi:ABC-type multidrug transport system fused ATPase/permease subunit